MAAPASITAEASAVHPAAADVIGAGFRQRTPRDRPSGWFRGHLLEILALVVDLPVEQPCPTRPPAGGELVASGA
jgi:hypothetical protein